MLLNGLINKLLMVAIAASLVGGCTRSSGGIAPGASAVAVQETLPPPDPMARSNDLQTYRIGPFDKVSINVFGATELTREVTVDSSGAIAMPLIGQIQAAGMTTAELGGAVAERLRGRYLRNPQVSVGVTEMRSQRFTVDGAVNAPGVYPVVGRMSLMQAIASARGATEFAALERIAIFRTVNNQRMAAVFNLRDIREGRYADPQIYADDVVVVGESGSRRFWRDIIQAIPVLGVFTPLV